MGKVLGHGRDAEQDAVGRGLYGLAVGHELQQTQPTVAAVAFPTAAKALDVEHHLVDILPCRVLVAAVGIVHLMVVAAARLLAVIRSGMPRMAADSQSDILAGIEQFLLNLLAIVARLNLVVLVVRIVCRLCPEQRVRQEDDGMVLVLLAVAETPRPFQHFVARRPLRTDDEQLSPMLVPELPSGILQGGLPLSVGEGCHQMLGGLAVAFGGIVFGVMGERLVPTDIAVLMIACRDDVGHLVVKPFQAMARPLPHLLARLVEHFAVGDKILVLLYKVAREEHGLDVQILHIVGNPSRTEFIKRLVDVVLRISLRVAENNESERLGVVKMLLVGTILRHKVEQRARKKQQE